MTILVLLEKMILGYVIWLRVGLIIGTKLGLIIDVLGKLRLCRQKRRRIGGMKAWRLRKKMRMRWKRGGEDDSKETLLLEEEEEEEVKEEEEEESEYETDSEEEHTGIAMEKAVYVPKSERERDNS
ncbi:hypothetical protein REPUB_Repub06bG0070100 [Reevesia pubescens]